MPAATIGLLGLAIAIVGLAFITQSILGGDGEASTVPGDTLATQQTLSDLQTATALAAAQETPDDSTDATAPGDDTDPDTEATATPDDTPDRPDGPFTHTVQSGDSCFGLANHYGTTVNAIIAANEDLDEECRLFVGQEVIIP